MKNEKAEGDVQYFATCTYCGMQTGLSLKQLESDEPLKCRACGAPLKVVPPRKRRPKKRKKSDRDYGALIADRYDYDRKLEEEKGTVLTVIYIAVGVLILILTLLTGRC